MAKDKAAKAAGKAQKSEKESKKTKTASDAAKPRTKGDAPLKPKAGPSSENSTVTSKPADESSKKKTKSDIKGMNKEDTSVIEEAAADEADLDENAILLREIKSLGGTEEDFEMLKDIDSDNEEADQAADTTVDDVSNLYLAPLHQSASTN